MRILFLVLLFAFLIVLFGTTVESKLEKRLIRRNQDRNLKQVPSLKRVKLATGFERFKNGRRAFLTQSNKILTAVKLRRGYPKSSITRLRVPIKNRKSSAVNVLNKSRREKNRIVYIPFRQNGIRRVIKAYIINNHRYIKKNIVIAKLANINSTLGSQNSGPINLNSNTSQKSNKILKPAKPDQAPSKNVLMPAPIGLVVLGGSNGLTHKPLANNAVLGIGNPFPQTNDHSLITKMDSGTDFAPTGKKKINLSSGFSNGGGGILLDPKPISDFNSVVPLTTTLKETPLPKKSEMFFPSNVIGLGHGGKIPIQPSAHGRLMTDLSSGNKGKHHINRETVSSSMDPSGGAYIIIYVPNRNTPLLKTPASNINDIFANSVPMGTENAAILPISPIAKRFSNSGSSKNTGPLLSQSSNLKSSVEPFADLGLASLLNSSLYPKSTGTLEPSILPENVNTVALAGKTPSEAWGPQNVAGTKKTNQTPMEVWGSNPTTNKKQTATNFYSATEVPPFMKENVKMSSTNPSTESKSDLKNRILRALLENIM